MRTEGQDEESKGPGGAVAPPARRRDNLHLFVLTAFAIAQPAYDRVGERPGFLADMGVRTPAIFLFALTFSLIIPALFTAVLWCLGKCAPRARTPIYTVIVFLLLTIIAAPPINRAAFVPPIVSIGAALAAGAAGTWVYFRFSMVRAVVTVAAPAVVAFPAIFLFASPVARELIFARRQIETARWKPVPVVMVVLDELCGMTLTNEQREIDADRFPHFAELARGCTWYRNASTVYPDTWQALPALLSGKFPSTGWPPTIADRPQNLFSVLRATGAYEFAAFEPVSRLAAERIENTEDPGTFSQLSSIMPAVGRVLLVHVTPMDLRSKLPEVPRLWFGFHDRTGRIDPQQRRGVFRYAKGDDRQVQFDHFLNCLEDSRQSGLYFLHVLLPHIPWCYLPSERRCIAESQSWELLDDILVADRLFVEQCQQRHLLQLEYVDREIGRLLERLRRTGLYDKCLLIVMADHGVSFQVGQPRRAVTDGNRIDLMAIPLFIKTPGQPSGAVSDKNVQSIDVLPTIADTLGIDLPLKVDGRSVFDAAAPERADKMFLNEYRLGNEPFRVPVKEFANSTVAREIRRRFGDPTDREALYRIGPHPELIGRPVADLTTSTDSPAELAMSRFGTDYSPDPATLVPCYFEGRVKSPAVTGASLALAVAINGTIRATTRTYEFDNFRDRFAALVPEWSFHEGRNDVQFYTVSGPADEPRLSKCAIHIAEARPD